MSRAYFGGRRFAIAAKEPAAAPSKVAQRYRSRSRTRPERERQERERESLERTCCARTSTSLQRTSPGRLRPSNTFRRNRDFSQLWTRAGGRDRDRPTRAAHVLEIRTRPKPSASVTFVQKLRLRQNNLLRQSINCKLLPRIGK